MGNISSGTWSLIGTLLDSPIKTTAACAAGFTNLGAAGDRVCFHKNVNGMWLLKQTLCQLCPEDNPWSMAELIAAAEQVSTPEALLEVDDPALWIQGDMASRINAQRVSRGLKPIEEQASAMPEFANLIFHSLTHRYAMVLADVESLTGKRLKAAGCCGRGKLESIFEQVDGGSNGVGALPRRCRELDCRQLCGSACYP